MDTYTAQSRQAAHPAGSQFATAPWPGAMHGADGDALRLDLTPVEHVLRQTRTVALGRYRCPPDHPQFLRGGGPHTCAYIAFHRTSVRLRIGDARARVATANDVSLHNVGQSYTREAVGPEGDDCDWLAVTPALLRGLGAADCGVPDERLFAQPFAPIGPAAFIAQRELFAAAADAATPLNALQVEEAVASLAGTILRDAAGFWGTAAQARRKPRPLCQRRRTQIIEDAKALLAREYWTDLSLADLARRLHCSAAHLSRMFHASTGYRLCAYRQELRLRKGLFLLEESGLEIGDIAVQVGFASHSHFTSAFHRRFGINPSQFLRWKSRRRIAAMAACRV